MKAGDILMNEKSQRVLVINTIGMNHEGITSVIINYISHMELGENRIDSIVSPSTPNEIIEKLSKYGQTMSLPIKKDNLKEYIKGLNNILRNNEYDVIHINGNSATMLIEVLLARHNKIKKILVHCHNTTCDHPYINKSLKLPMIMLSTHLLSCSQKAGQWLYGHKKFTVLNNAIDLERYKYNENIREKLRKKNHFTNEYIIGHIGHFTEQKNHKFLIDIFQKYHELDKQSYLVLIGDGPRKKEIEDYVKGKKLTNNVLFWGQRDNVNELYNIFDLFLFPSLWEGLPVVMLEAQANSLPLLVSDVITEEAKCTPTVQYHSLINDAADWAGKIVELRRTCKCRNENMSKYLRKNGFDINSEAHKLQQIYFSESQIDKDDRDKNKNKYNDGKEIE